MPDSKSINTMLSDENRYRLLKLLETNPQMNQRQLANTLGMSLGKTNYCLKALIDKGWVKMSNFSRSKNKSSYIYLLTPRGLEEKARVTFRFLSYKQKEFETLKQELADLRAEAEQLSRSKGVKGARE